MEVGLFTVEDRNRVREHALEMAARDERVVAGAVVGSLAQGGGDRWSDLDLTFGVRDDVSLVEILDDWTCELVTEFDAVHLFDLPSGPSLYRVLLLPGALQFDLSFTSATQFRARGPKFELLFGIAAEPDIGRPPRAEGLFGHAAHHALRARFSIERGRFGQAEYWISGVRDNALALACVRHDRPAHHGRGLDDLPAGILDSHSDALVRRLDRVELLRALGEAIEGLLRESVDVGELATRVAPRLRSLTGDL